MAEVHLDETDWRAMSFAVAEVCRLVPLVHPSVHRLNHKLANAIYAVSPRGHENDSTAGQLSHEELVGTRAAALMLGWDVRRVRRHQADLGGRRLGDRLVFDAAAVREFAEALSQNGD